MSLKKDEISAQAIMCAYKLSTKIKYKWSLVIKYKKGWGVKDIQMSWKYDKIFKDLSNCRRNFVIL